MVRNSSDQTALTREQTKVDIRLSDVDEMRDHATPLFREHWEEVETHPESRSISIDWKRYYELEERRVLLILGAWSGDVLVGYSINFLSPHPHYSTLMQCENHLVFISSPWRRGGVGSSLIHETERAGKDAGAHLMLWHAKPGTNLDLLLPKLGYGLEENSYSAEL